MPTVNEVLGGWLQSAGKNWKSTVQSLLTTVMTLAPLLIFWHKVSPTFLTALLGVLGTLKVSIGGVQVDPTAKPAAQITNKDNVLVPAGTEGK